MGKQGQMGRREESRGEICRKEAWRSPGKSWPGGGHSQESTGSAETHLEHTSTVLVPGPPLWAHTPEGEQTTGKQHANEDISVRENTNQRGYGMDAGAATLN